MYWEASGSGSKAKGLQTETLKIVSPNKPSVLINGLALGFVTAVKSCLTQNPSSLVVL